jgi:hypoxanthine phosphoribosyltransferase
MRDPSEAWDLLREAELICEAGEVSRAIHEMAGKITAELADTYPLVLAVMSGAVYFAGQLLPLLRFPLDFDYIHVTRYGSSIVGSQVEWRIPPPSSVRGRTVLVLDDILDGGTTMAAIRDSIVSLGAKTVYCAVLTEKDLGQPKPVIANFVGIRLPDRFVFGCGMDARGYWRNLPEIYALKGE